MKKAVYIALALVMALSLVACGNSDADRDDNTKDGVIGNGENDLERGLDDIGDGIRDGVDGLGDGIRDGVDDITGGNAGHGTENGGTNSGMNGTNGSGMNGTGTTGNRANGSAGTGVNGAPGAGTYTHPYGSGTMTR